MFILFINYNYNLVEFEKCFINMHEYTLDLKETEMIDYLKYSKEMRKHKNKIIEIQRQFIMYEKHVLL